MSRMAPSGEVDRRIKMLTRKREKGKGTPIQDKREGKRPHKAGVGGKGREGEGGKGHGPEGKERGWAISRDPKMETMDDASAAMQVCLKRNTPLHINVHT